MILVIGATGTIGQHIVDGLRAQGAPVRVLARQPEKARDRFPGVEVAAGDLDRPETLEAAMRGVERIFLLTAPTAQQATQVDHVLQAAKRAGVRHVVRLSAMGAAADAHIGFSRDHFAAEQAIKQSGLAWTILQPTGFMDNFLGSAHTIATQGTIYAPVGDGAVAFVDARDIADVAVAALTSPGHEGKTYALTGPAAVTHAQAARVIGEAIGKEVRYVDVPPEAAKDGMVKAGMPPAFADDLVALYDVYKKGYAATATGEVEKVTGKPARSFETFVTDHLEAFRGQPVHA